MSADTKTMWAYGCVHKDDPSTADAKEGIYCLEVPVPVPNSDEVLIKPIFSGLNYNTIWSSLRRPISPEALIGNFIQRNPSYEHHKKTFAIFGSDAVGSVVAIGRGVRNIKEGDVVVAHCGVCPTYENRVESDTLKSDSFGVWGYETNYGAHAQYALIHKTQIISIPPRIEVRPEFGSSCLTLATAYRMLCTNNGAIVKNGDRILIWGAAGGLGMFASQLGAFMGGRVLAVVSSLEKKRFLESVQIGNESILCLEEYELTMNDFILKSGEPNYVSWRKVQNAVKRLGFGQFEVIFEHPGKTSLGLSVYLLSKGGTAVICAASSGYLATIDLRYLWMNVKRIQGSHFANISEANRAMNLLFSGAIRGINQSQLSIHNIKEAVGAMSEGRSLGKTCFDHHA